MSQENVEVVRHATQQRDGKDLVPWIREFVESVDWSDPDAVAAAVAEEAQGRYLDPDIEWEWEATGAVGDVFRGLYGVARYWADWAADWESYVYRVKEYRNLGSWVLTLADVKAVGRGGIPVEMQVFQMWQVRDGKVSVMRAFLSEAEALEAVGLSE
jgi:ketosteroid isomerase-like protein